MTFAPLRKLLPPTTCAVAAIAGLGLLLRIAAARGGLWVDEAWSVHYVREAGGPAGIFTRINHDNNHHLNSLWLYLVGPAAPPLLARALAIVTGTASIFVAAVIGARRGPTCAWVTAALFAIAEVMVTYGSEARGYAPMLLALLVAIAIVDRWLEEPASRPPTIALAIVCAIGAIAHMTMLLGVPLLGAWILLVETRRTSIRAAFETTVRVAAPAAIAVFAFAYLVALAAAHSATGFRIGGYSAFSGDLFAQALGAVVKSSLGPTFQPVWLLPALIALALAAILILRPSIFGTRGPLYVLAILGFPFAVWLLQPGNSDFVRYYFISVVALLLLVSQAIAAGLASSTLTRSASALALTAIVVLGLSNDLELIRNQRGRPDGPVAEIAAREPKGAAVLIGQERPEAVLEVAAAERSYPLRMIRDTCADARFYYADQNPGPPAPNRVKRCGMSFSVIASADYTGLSGVRWTLYERDREVAGGLR